MATVATCRELLEANSPELVGEFRQLMQNFSFGSIEDRIKVCDDGTLALVLDIVKRQSASYLPVVVDCFEFIHDIIAVWNVDDEREMIPIDRFCEMGGVPLLAAEFERRVREFNSDNLLLTFAWMATNDRATPHIVATGMHKIPIRWVKENDPAQRDRVDTSLSFLRTASACPSTRQQIRDDGGLDAALKHLECLKGDSAEDIRRGFRTGSIVARLAGNDETGVGPQILRGNPLLITKTVHVLEKVLDAGPQGTYLNMLINPHFITMDLLTIAVSDANKPLLKSSIPVLIKGLKLRGETNEEMVVDIISIFLQLTYDKDCLATLQSNKMEISDFIEKNVMAPKYDIGPRLSAQNLLNALSGTDSASTAPQSAPGAPPKSGTRLFGGLVRRAVKENKEAAAATGGRRKSAVLNEKHVMLSYNWDIKPIVQRVDDVLRANGVKTWIDERDMGPNLNDSMSSAIENAAAIFVFMTGKYKESANCRKECEYADGFKIPIVYIMAEESYKPNGWLGIQLGKAMWVPCWSLEEVDKSAAQLVQRAKQAANVSSSSTAQPVVVPASTSASKSAAGTSAGSSSSSNSEMIALLKAMHGQLEQLQSKVLTLETQVSQLSAKVDGLKQ